MEMKYFGIGFAIVSMVGTPYLLEASSYRDCKSGLSAESDRRCNPYSVNFVYVDSSSLVPDGRNDRKTAYEKKEALFEETRKAPTLEDIMDRYVRKREEFSTHGRQPLPQRVTEITEENLSTGEANRTEPPIVEKENNESEKRVETSEKYQEKQPPPPPVEEEYLPPKKVCQYFGWRSHKGIRFIYGELPPDIEESFWGFSYSFPVLTSEELVIWLMDHKLAERISHIKKRPPSGLYKGKKIVHTIKPGETLSHIAHKYKTSVYDLRILNDMRDDVIIRAGKKLKVTYGFVTPKNKRKELEIKIRTGTYEVRSGDTLLGICRMFKIDPSRVCRMNGISKKIKLRAGKWLTLPIPQEKLDRIVEMESIKKAIALKRKKRREKRERIANSRYRIKYKVDNRKYRHRKRVIATAYTSHIGQTDDTPFMAAWNNRIAPGMKIIAVSNDLIWKYGLTNGKRVKISGLEGTYIVRDKMNKRLKNHIDIYMGTNRKKALEWGRRSVYIYW